VATESTWKPAAKSLAGPRLYIAGAVAMLGGALFYYLEFTKSGPPPDLPLTPEAKAYVRNLQLADVGMKGTDSYVGQTIVEIVGNITNGGGRGLDTVEIYCIFYDAYGQLVLRKRLPIVGGGLRGKTGGLKPGETKAFRLPFDELPQSWNQAMPQLVIAGMKFS
jgi:hypothetical protein